MFFGGISRIFRQSSPWLRLSAKFLACGSSNVVQVRLSPLLMFGSVVNLSPPRWFYASSTFLSFLGFPPSCSLTVYLSQCYAVRQQITLGDLCWFWLHPVQIGHLWEFQPSQSHRETDLSGEYLLIKQAVSGATIILLSPNSWC